MKQQILGPHVYHSAQSPQQDTIDWVLKQMFFTVLEAKESKIKVLASMMSDERILLSLQPSYCILTTWRESLYLPLFLSGC